MSGSESPRSNERTASKSGEKKSRRLQQSFQRFKFRMVFKVQRFKVPGSIDVEP